MKKSTKLFISLSTAINASTLLFLFLTNKKIRKYEKDKKDLETRLNYAEQDIDYLTGSIDEAKNEIGFLEEDMVRILNKRERKVEKEIFKKAEEEVDFERLMKF